MAGKITYKIDRLSNSALELGLKTGAILTGSSTKITSAKPVEYTTAPTLGDSDSNVLTHKLYVDNAISTAKTSIINILKGLITADETITITKNWATGTGEADPIYKIGVATYDNLTANKVFGTGTLTESSTESGKVVSGLEIDKYGRVVSLKYTQVSVANLDLSSNSQLDNYVQWNIKVGSEATTTANAFAVTSGNSNQTAKAKADSVEAITGTSAIGLNLLAGDGVALTANTTAKSVTFSVQTTTDGAIVINDGKLNLDALSTNDVTSGFYKIAYDKYGRVTASTAVAASDIRGLTGINHSSSTNGLVNAKSSSNTTTASTSTYFYTSDGKWASIPYNKVDVAKATAESPILAAASSDSSVTTVKSAATIDASGNIKTTGSITGGAITGDSFSGNGAALSALNASNISSGTISKDRLPLADIRSSVVGGTNLTANTVLIGGANNTVKSLANPSDNSADYVLSATSSKAPYWASINDLVGDIASSVVSSTGGFVFKGILGTGENQIESLPTTNFKKGYFYRVGTAGTYAGNYCEVGDAIYAIKDCVDGATSDNTYWSALEQNITDNVTYSSSSITDGVLAIKTAGSKIVMDGLNAKKETTGWILTTNISGSAQTLANSRTLWGQSFNGSGNVSGDISNTGNILPSATDNSSIGSKTNEYLNVYSKNINATNVTATTFTGTLSGKASTAGTADKVANSITFKNIGTGDNVTYDGSTSKEVDLSASSLGFISSFADITAPTGNNNAISKLSITKSDDGIVTVSPTYTTLVSNVTSDKFEITSNGAAKTIGYKTSRTAGCFYTGTTGPSSTNRLNYDGNFYATNIYVGADQIAVMKAVKATENTILLANGSGQGKSSSYTITTSPTTDNDTAILTSSAVHTAIETAISTGVKCVSITFSGTTVSLGASKLPNNAVIEHIDVVCDTGYATNPAFLLQIDGETYVGSDDNPVDLTTAGDVFTYKFSKKLSKESTLALSGLTGTGAGRAYIYYI